MVHLGDERIDRWHSGNINDGDLCALGRITAQELKSQCQEFLKALKDALALGTDVNSDAYLGIRNVIAEISRSRATQGYSPTETASFVFSLKQPLFSSLNSVHGSDPAQITRGVLETTILLDKLGLITFETYVKAREDVIVRQSREIAELSTPVVKLWDGILALPLIGTLDSEGTQVVMETLLEATVQQSSMRPIKLSDARYACNIQGRVGL